MSCRPVRLITTCSPACPLMAGHRGGSSKRFCKKAVCRRGKGAKKILAAALLRDCNHRVLASSYIQIVALSRPAFSDPQSAWFRQPMYVCMYVSLCVYMSVYLSVSLPACLSACLATCLSVACLSVCLSAFLLA